MSVAQRVRSIIRDVPDFPKPGILFKDITPILMDAPLCTDITHEMFGHFTSKGIDAIVGVESRGFLFGMLLAQRFNVPFIPIRKKGKLPSKTLSFEYHLEYGSATVEIHEGDLKPGSNVLIHDDLLATGGTAAAAAELVLRSQGNVAGFAFLVGLDFLNGADVLRPYSTDIFSIVNY